MGYDTVRLGGIDVCFTTELDGGGARYGQDFVGFVAENIGVRGRGFEWCAGPGFIGFSLLGHGLVDSLCLADVNPAAVDACRETIRRNDLSGVEVYVSDGLEDIPTSERWDLVVGNPPHSGSADIVPDIARPPMIYRDAGWLLHRRFYASVGRHLRDGSDIVVQENARFSEPSTFLPMLEENDLELVGTPRCATPVGNTLYYYVWSKLRA